jgi:branched-chain amino acid transport system permease protein
VTLATLLQSLFSGLTMGAVYAFVALGFSVTYSSSGIINFAQGEFVMLGGIIAATLFTLLGWPVLAAMAGGVVATAVIGLVVGHFFIRPMYRATEFRKILVTLGLATLLQVFALIIWRTDPWSFPPLLGTGILRVGPATITLSSVVVIVVTLVTLAAYLAYMRRSRWGRAMVATSINSHVAAALGVNVPVVIALAFVLSAAFGGLAGVLLTPIVAMDYQVGFLMSIKGFTAAVLGGMGSASGAVVGGFVLGLAEALGSGVISSGYRDVVALGILIALLMIRPEGLLGRRVRRV